MRYIFFTVIIAFYHSYFAQPIPKIIWEKNFGGSNDDYANGLDITNDGGYIVAGSTKSNDHDISGTTSLLDFWIIKVDDSGKLVWEKNYGGSQEEEAMAIRTNPDGSFIVVGYSDSDDRDVSGHHGTVSYSDCWVMKLNKLGNVIWKKSYGGSNDDVANDVRRTRDGGYIITGWTNSVDGDVQNVVQQGYNYWVFKISSSGVLEWQKTFGGSEQDVSFAVEQTSDDGYVIAGVSDTKVTFDKYNSDYYIVKLDQNGAFEWEKSIGTLEYDCATSLCESHTGGIMVLGHSEGDYRLLELDLSGKILSDHTYGGSSGDFARSIRRTKDNGYILGGASYSRDGDVSGGIEYKGGFWITKLNSDTITWETRVATYESDYGTEAIEGHNGSYLITGHIHNNGHDASTHYGNNDIWLVKIGLDYVGLNDKINGVKNQIYPNPFKNELTVQTNTDTEIVRVYDLLGKLVYESSLKDTLNINVNPGSYLLRLYDFQGFNHYSELLIKE